MPVTTENHEEDYTRYEPTDFDYFDLEGLDTANLRREFAQPFALGMDDKYIERRERDVLDPRSIELPSVDTVPEEISTTGMESLTIDGKRWDTFGMSDGFVVNQFDENRQSWQRDGVYRRFDWTMDALWFNGMAESDQWNGMFPYINSSLPSSRVIDCSAFTSSGDQQDLTGREEDLMSVVAAARVEERMQPEESIWTMAVGDRNAIISLNASQPTDVGRSGPSYLERLQNNSTLQRTMKLPRERQFMRTPRDSELENEEVPSFDIVDTSTAVNPDGPQIGYDELYLFPDMDRVSTNYWALGETPTPVYDTYEMRKRRVAHDYFTNYTAYENPSGEYGDVPALLKLENVSALFGETSDPTLGSA